MIDYTIQTWNSDTGRWTLVPGAIYPEGATYVGGRSASDACSDACNRLESEFPGERFRIRRNS